MKTIVLAGVAMVALSVGAWAVLNGIGFSAADTTASDSVRLE
ncbi:MAG: hypothetical protein AAFQ36_09905 [Pseudomonadota bacterium]